MALFKFKKKSEESAEPEAAPAGPPVEQVRAMRQQGLSNNQIIQQLSRDGFKPSLIYDAMNQADLASTEPIGAQPAEPGALPPEPAPMEQPLDTGGFDQTLEEPGYGSDNEMIEEVAESIIDEKWAELMKDVNKIVDWKNEMDTKITSIEQKIDDLKDNFKDLQKGVLAKVSQYDKNIINVGTELKAMEKVFQKLLPSLTENVNELSRITRRSRTKKK